MKVPSDQIMAKHYLAHREAGTYSILNILRRSAKRYIFSLILMVLLAVMATYTTERVLRIMGLIGVGMYIGMFLRDFGWFRNIKASWPFTEKIIDWQKVEAIAKGDEA
jgi:hypothetical protein